MSFLDDRDLARRGRDAREWLLHDDRGRVIGLVIFSVAISIAMSLLATMIVGLISRRRAGSDEPMDSEGHAEDMAGGEEAVGVPVMEAAVPSSPAESEVQVEA